MSHPSLLDLLTMIQAARHARGADRERHLERAENTCRAMVRTSGTRGFCFRDAEPCAPECTFSLAPSGLCGRVIPPPRASHTATPQERNAAEKAP